MMQHKLFVVFIFTLLVHSQYLHQYHQQFGVINPWLQYQWQHHHRRHHFTYHNNLQYHQHHQLPQVGEVIAKESLPSIPEVIFIDDEGESTNEMFKRYYDTSRKFVFHYAPVETHSRRDSTQMDTEENVPIRSETFNDSGMFTKC